MPNAPLSEPQANNASPDESYSRYFKTGHKKDYKTAFERCFKDFTEKHGDFMRINGELEEIYTSTFHAKQAVRLTYGSHSQIYNEMEDMTANEMAWRLLEYLKSEREARLRDQRDRMQEASSRGFAAQRYQPLIGFQESYIPPLSLPGPPSSMRGPEPPPRPPKTSQKQQSKSDSDQRDGQDRALVDLDELEQERDRLKERVKKLEKEKDDQDTKCGLELSKATKATEELASEKIKWDKELIWLNGQKDALREEKNDLNQTIGKLREELKDLGNDMDELHKGHETAKEKLQKDHEVQLAELRSKHEKELGNKDQKHSTEIDGLKGQISSLVEEKEELQKKHAEELKTQRDGFRAEIDDLRSSHEKKVAEIYRKHSKEVEDLKSENVEAQKWLKGEVKSYSATLLNRDIRDFTMFEMGDLNPINDSVIKEKFSSLNAAVDSLSRLKWKPSPKIWTSELIQKLSDNDRVLKKRILLDTIWTLLYRFVFCSPFRIFGEEGEDLELKWNENCGKGWYAEEV